MKKPIVFRSEDIAELLIAAALRQLMEEGLALPAGGGHIHWIKVGDSFTAQVIFDEEPFRVVGDLPS